MALATIALSLSACNTAPELQGATSPATRIEDAPAAGGGDSTTCVEAMQTAADEARDNYSTGTEDEAAIIATVTACTTVEDWVAALRQYPLAMGLDAGSAIDPGIELAGLCDSNDAPVCADARERGLNTYWR